MHPRFVTVTGRWERTLWCREVDDVAVALEHVDLLDGLNRLDVELLEGGLKLLVVGAGALVDLLDLPARSTLASALPVSLISQKPQVLLCGRDHDISMLQLVFPGLWCKRKLRGGRGWRRGLLTLFTECVSRLSALELLGRACIKRLRAWNCGRTYQCAPTPAYAPTWPDPYLRLRGGGGVGREAVTANMLVDGDAKFRIPVLEQQVIAELCTHLLSGPCAGVKE
jgi:hypothetical protein